MAAFHLTSVPFLWDFYAAEGDTWLCRNSLKQIIMSWTGITKNVRMVIIVFDDLSVLSVVTTNLSPIKRGRNGRAVWHFSAYADTYYRRLLKGFQSMGVAKECVHLTDPFSRRKLMQNLVVWNHCCSCFIHSFCRDVCTGLEYESYIMARIIE